LSEPSVEGQHEWFQLLFGVRYAQCIDKRKRPVFDKNFKGPKADSLGGHSYTG